MATRRPLVIVAGTVKELPVGDSVAGAGADFDSLPDASDDIPDEFIVNQGGVWARATYGQMLTWLVPLPAGTVTVGGETVFVNSEIVTAT